MPSVNSKAHQENKIKLKIVRRTRESFPLAFVRCMFVKWISPLENIRGSKIRYIISIFLLSSSAVWEMVLALRKTSSSKENCVNFVLTALVTNS